MMGYKAEPYTVYHYDFYTYLERATRRQLEEQLEAYNLYKENISIINQLAYTYYYLSDYFHALDYVMKIHNLPEQARNKEEYYFTLKLTGDIYRKLNINESSIYYYMEALKAISEIDPKRKRCQLTRLISMVYTKTRAVELAMDYAVESLQLSELIMDNKLIGDANFVLCKIHSLRKQYEKALKFGLKALEMFKAVNAHKGLTLVYLEIANIYANENDQVLAQNFYEKALMTSTEINYSEGMIFGNYLLGKLLFKQGYYERALIIVEEGIAISRKNNANDIKADLYYLISEIYAAHKEFELAYNALRTGMEIQQHILAERNKEKIYKLQNDYNLYIKNKELKQYMEQNSSLEKINRQLSEEVQHDALTNLLNRRGLRRTISNLGFDGNHILILGDIDDFKRVNDECGHPCGDILLLEIARVLRDTCKSHYRVARWGGEEFLMVLPSTTLESAIEFVRKVMDKISNIHITHEDKAYNITMTFGLATMIGDFETSIHLADQRLYYGKRNGKNQIIYD
jgi:diguanylate cyclase (GGDEF)-like protein